MHTGSLFLYMYLKKKMNRENNTVPSFSKHFKQSLDLAAEL